MNNFLAACTFTVTLASGSPKAYLEVYRELLRQPEVELRDLSHMLSSGNYFALSSAENGDRASMQAAFTADGTEALSVTSEGLTLWDVVGFLTELQAR